ncbi:S-adenosyl-L-methionine-dependent methyltransferase [Entophlyctis helioformis]|nr:S-adenosyl-L-methionine-dependent methyltransferase [Entophlyctis helioformis]
MTADCESSQSPSQTAAQTAAQTATPKQRNTVYDDDDFDSAKYSQYRPTYPPSLLDLVLAFHRRHDGAALDLAIDVATGTGQTALALADVFTQVVGTDISATMLRSAAKHPSVEYRVATAETFVSQGVIAPESVDLIAVSTAAHWFDMAPFYDQCFKAIKPSGTVAVWAYLHFEVHGFPEITRLHHEYSEVFLADYWDKRRDRLDRRYTDDDFIHTPFPVFQRLVVPQDNAATYKERHPTEPDPVDVFCDQMMKIIGTDSMDAELTLTWPLVVLLMKKSVTDAA